MALTHSAIGSGLFAPAKKLKVAVIGAGGKIGKEVLKTIWAQPKRFPEMGSFIALAPTPSTLQGLYMDYGSAHPPKPSHIKVQSSNSPDQLKDADIVFVIAGLWPTEDVRQEWEKKDSTGRLVQSAVNYNLIKKICGDISVHAPNAKVFVMTNQVDMMAYYARQMLPRQEVFGIGGLIDSERFKFVLASLLGINDVRKIQAHIIGYHNNDMLLLKDSLFVDDKAPDWNDPKFVAIVNQAMELTKLYGKKVFELQRNKHFPGLDTGSAILPAKAITDVMQAMCGGQPLVAPFNIKLDPKTASRYGVNGLDLSVPVAIHGMQITPVLFNVASNEKDKLQKAQYKLHMDRQKLIPAKARELSGGAAVAVVIEHTSPSSAPKLLPCKL